MFHTMLFFFSLYPGYFHIIFLPFQATLNCVFIVFLVSLTLLGMLCFVVRFSHHCGHLNSPIGTVGCHMKVIYDKYCMLSWYCGMAPMLLLIRVLHILATIAA